jgi:hypothetical protein
LRGRRRGFGIVRVVGIVAVIRVVSIKGCSDLEIVRSTLISNEEWKKLGEDAR